MCMHTWWIKNCTVGQWAAAGRGPLACCVGAKYINFVLPKYFVNAVADYLLLLCSFWFVSLLNLQYNDRWTTAWFWICDMTQNIGHTTGNLSIPRGSLNFPSPSPFPVSLTFQRFLLTSTMQIFSAINLWTMRFSVLRSHRSPTSLPNRLTSSPYFNYANELLRATSQLSELMLFVLTGHQPIFFTV